MLGVSHLSAEHTCWFDHHRSCQCGPRFPYSFPLPGGVFEKPIRAGRCHDLGSSAECALLLLVIIFLALDVHDGEMSRTHYRRALPKYLQLKIHNMRSINQDPYIQPRGHSSWSNNWIPSAISHPLSLKADSSPVKSCR